MASAFVTRIRSLVASLSARRAGLSSLWASRAGRWQLGGALLLLIGCLVGIGFYLVHRSAARAHRDDPYAWDGNLQGKFVVSLCRDRQGNVWAGTEGEGVWRNDLGASRGQHWTQFNAKNGLGDDNAYALCCDTAGRVWVGTLNHGVSVFNGQEWKTYAPPDGPLGSRVFALAVSPKDGDVWGATEAGLFRYSQSRSAWLCYTHADGLPADQANALAFAPDGTLYVGTQCDGIGIASPADDYKTWRIVSGPAAPPLALRGSGLPSALINCLLVTQDGTVWAGTVAGLAHSGDSGRTWQFRRGNDWRDKAAGQFEAGLAGLAVISGIEVIPANGSGFAVSAAGPAAGRFLASRGFAGGKPSATKHPIDTAPVQKPAPQTVYQKALVGNSVFTATHLKPGERFRVRLHFAETGVNKAKRRVFNVSVNGRRVLDHFDVFQAAGAENRAVVREISAQADASGKLQVTFAGAAPGSDGAGLNEDYVTCLAEGSKNRLLVGHRQQALEVIDLKSGASLSRGRSQYVEALLLMRPGSALLGNYGSGLLSLPVRGLRPPTVPRAARRRAPVVSQTARLPAPASPPDLAALNQMRAEVSKVKPNAQEMQPHAAVLADDWVTEGDWLGRYGRYWACLAATFHPIPEDYLWGAGWEPVNYSLTMGPNHGRRDSLRYWMQWRYTDDPRILEMPAAYVHSRVLKGYTTWDKGRRETEVDDHGETYPEAMDGPNIYATLTVPDGLYYLSLYDVNYNGQTGRQCTRDYRISVRPHAGASMEDVGAFKSQPEWAHGRIQQFWGGVWKRFLVRGPTTLTIEVNRNNSFNTMLPAVMLDLAEEDPPPYFQTVDQWTETQAEEEKTRLALTAHPTPLRPAHSEEEAANALFDALAEKRLTNSVWWATEGRRYYAPLQRWYAAAAQKPATGPRTLLDRHLATCDWQMGQYQPWEDRLKASGQTTARDIEKSLRWDGVTDSYSGLGNQIVTARLSELSGRKVSMTP